MIRFPQAKINLGLDITGKRADGFHDIETCMVQVPLCDALEMLPAGNEDQLTVTGMHLAGESKDNLVLKAVGMLREDHGFPALNIHLHKAIPAGAGLGGGSSDGACMLEMVNEVFDLGLSLEVLEHYASRLGSDCPFFLKHEPAFLTGRGEVSEPAYPDLAGLGLVIVQPGFSIGTAFAYSKVKPKPPTGIKEMVARPVWEWKNVLINHFEEPMGSIWPELLSIKSRLQEAGAIYASLSGSGSAIYGLFEEIPAGLQKSFKGNFYWEGLL